MDSMQRCAPAPAQAGTKYKRAAMATNAWQEAATQPDGAPTTKQHNRPCATARSASTTNAPHTNAPKTHTAPQANSAKTTSAKIRCAPTAPRLVYTPQPAAIAPKQDPTAQS